MPLWRGKIKPPVELVVANLRIFRGYLSGEKDIGEIAEEEGIQYESAAQRVRRAKVKIKVQMVGFLEGIA